MGIAGAYKASFSLLLIRARPCSYLKLKFHSLSLSDVLQGQLAQPALSVLYKDRAQPHIRKDPLVDSPSTTPTRAA